MSQVLDINHTALSLSFHSIWPGQVCYGTENLCPPLASMNVRLKDKRGTLLIFSSVALQLILPVQCHECNSEFPTTEGTPMPLTSVKGSWLPVNLAKLILCKAIHSTVGQPKWLKCFTTLSSNIPSCDFHLLVLPLYTGATESLGNSSLAKEER